MTTVASAVALTAGMVMAVPVAANAAVSTDAPVIINEVYGGGGNGGALYKRDFVELYNTTEATIDLSTWSVQYASKSGSSWQITTLDGVSIAAGGYIVVGEATGAGGTEEVPADVDGSIAMSGSGGKVALVSGADGLGCGHDCTGDASVVDFVGWGGADDAAGGNDAPSTENFESVSRDALHTNTADNAADFALSDPPSPGTAEPEAPPDSGDKTIAEIQGESDTSPLANTTVTTTGVVTAAYPTGGYFGFAIQTPDTGGDIDLDTHHASDAIWVYMTFDAGPVTVEIGDYVQVFGLVSEYKSSGSPRSLTEIEVAAADDVVQLTDTVVAPKAITGAWPATDQQRESIESMLFSGDGDYTISNTYTTNQYGEVGLAYGDTPLMQWTDVAAPGSDEADDVIADNAARGVVLDDGASTNFFDDTDQTPPYISLADPLRVGETVTFTDDVIVDYRNGAWKLQPTGQVTPAGGDYPVTWTDNRTTEPDAAAIGDGDLRIASFNVLNYFTTLGESREDCSPYTDRDGHGITTRSCTGPNGPRGAWDAASLQRQQDKIVHAINALDADVVGLMEIENSLVVEGSGHEDEALSTLVDALNDDAGSTKWAFVPSSTDLPDASEMDVITNAIIYQVDSVQRLGDSHALGDQSGEDEPFVNAREPIAQAFTPADGGDPFTVVVNHLKSKGSAGPLDGDEDSGDGQGASNASRMAQATALAAWVTDTLIPQTGVDDVFLAGDFNSYTMEDPLQILYDGGWEDLNSHYETGKQSYNFGGMNGSLDHVLANASALARTTGADIWNINAPESIALEYSRYNYHGTLFYDDSPYRSSDHDPVVVGVDSGAPPSQQIQILGINDFHGRIQANGQEAGAAVLAGAVNELRDDNPDTVFAAAGDLIGASTFESFIAHDKPTIDALNAAGLDVSSVGNHEFDQGYDDLVNRVMAAYDEDTNPYGGAQWTYLGANVKFRDSGDPALDPTWVKTFGDIEVGFVGAVTEHLPELVSPAGIADIEVTDIADAVNAEADALKADGVDIVVMLVHEGAPNTDCESVTDPTNDFGDIVTRLDANVDAVISGHTHLTYNCLVDVPAWQTEGRAVTQRPVVSAGQYGYNLDQLLFTVSGAGEVTGVASNTIALTSQVPDPEDPDEMIWVPNFEPDGTVGEIVSQAVADAEVLGAVPLGEIGGPFNRAKDSASVENRGGESTLGNLVAEAQRWATESETAGSAQIAFMNPGGLRADMLGNDTEGYPAVLTYKQAATVQPFANTLVNMTLTGAQIRQVLEQQWQPAGASRPFLRLGISKGFSYTYDPNGSTDNHILQMWLNGEPIEADASYSVTVNSFLAAGGDNFTELASGANPRDTGQTDLQGMVDYMAANAPEGTPLPVDNSQRSVGVTYISDPGGHAGGDEVTFDLSSLSMSTGTVFDDMVTVSLDGTELGAFGVDSTVDADKDDETGTAHVVVTLPPGTPVGTANLTVTGATTGTVTTVPFQVTTPTFTDVAADNPFVDDIAWMADNGITEGYADGTFRPASALTRQVIAAFMYRMVEGTEKPLCDPGDDRVFTDVPATNPFCGEIEALAALGIVSGQGGGTFEPGSVMGRQAAAAMIYRFLTGGDEDLSCTGTAREFSDVPASNPFCGDIEWLADNDIVNGYANGTFKPTRLMTRQAAAGMLHRAVLATTPE